MAATARVRLGYLVPEFPGQTHSFFWRELQALPGNGVSPELVSTRRPAKRVNAHSWGADAEARTVYLTDGGARALAALAAECARAAPAGWLRCLAAIARARGVNFRGRLRLLGLALLGARLAAVARDRGWAHVHVHSCADSAHIALFASLLSHLSYSVTLHGPLEDYGPNQREKWRHARFALVITRQLLGEVNDQLAGSLPPRVAIAPMGVDLHDFRRSRPYLAWDGAGPLRIFSCGRLNPGKGHADLIEAVLLLRHDGIDTRLVIAGEDEGGGTGYRRTLEARIAEAGAAGAVTLLGAVDEHAIREGLEDAHLFALASRCEPLGVAIMEAMAMQVPVVATGAGGVPELVDDDVDGVLTPPGMPRLLADRLAALARDPCKARSLGAAGRSKVEARFSSTRGAAILAEMLATG